MSSLKRPREESSLGEKEAPKDDKKAIILAYFPEVTGLSKADRKEAREFRCEVCGDKYSQKLHSGMGNLWSHITSTHKDYATAFKNFSTDSNSQTHSGLVQRSLKDYSINQEEFRRMKWLNAGISKNMPFSFVEEPAFRELAGDKGMSTETYMKLLVRVSDEIEGIIKEELPDKFGLVFDGWSAKGDHFVGLYAVYSIEQRVVYRLLRFSTFDQHYAEAQTEEKIRFGAKEYKEFIESSLREFYDKPFGSVLYLVGDNCAVNRRLADDMDIPLVGCYSHRLNLGIREYIDQHLRAPIDALREFMKILRKGSNFATLKARKVPLPVLPNETRWSGIFDMIDAYDKIKEHMNVIIRLGDDVARKIPSESHEKMFKKFGSVLKCFKVATKALQEEHVSLLNARKIFDYVLDETAKLSSFSNLRLKDKLTEAASIVHRPLYQAAVIKALRGEHLDEVDRLELYDFQLETVDLLTSSSPGYMDDEDDHARKLMNILQQSNTKEERPMYSNLECIPATSNKCERLFSRAKFAYTDLRSSMEYDNLEYSMYLLANKELWQYKLVKKF